MNDAPMLDGGVKVMDFQTKKGIRSHMAQDSSQQQPNTSIPGKIQTIKDLFAARPFAKTPPRSNPSTRCDIAYPAFGERTESQIRKI